MQTTYDPFGHCESSCNHDLAPGVLVADLLERDGPHPPLQVVLSFATERGWRRMPAERVLPAAG